MDAYREAKIETETKRHLQKGLKLNPKFSYTIIARDAAGKIVGKTKKIAGLNTSNFGILLSNVLSNTQGVVNMTDTSGASEPFYIWTSSFYHYTYVGLYPFVQLGTGTTPPTRGDYNLETPIAGTANLLFQYLTNTGTVLASATILYPAAVSPSEVILFFSAYSDSGTPGMVNVTLDHAVFSALPSAVSFTIIYEVALS